MIMRKALSWIHFLGCIGWTLFWLIMLAEKGGNMLEAEGLIASIALLLTTGTGIYLFMVGSNRQLSQLEKIKTDNKILQARLEQSKLQQELSSTQTETSEQSN